MPSLKRFLQDVARSAASPMFKQLSNELRKELTELRVETCRLRSEISHVGTQEAQVALRLAYREWVMNQRYPLPTLADVGFRCYSQFEEDGILLFLFAVIGTTNRKTVEICAGDGAECNTANLIINHGWQGHLFDGDEGNVASGNRFFRALPETQLYPPKFTHAWITSENVNEVISSSGAKGEIDLLSLDIDGMDYWVWRAIDCIKPRVVVCETHSVIHPDDALTVPYDPHFRATIPDYHSASLAAMTKLGIEKGYRLIGTHRYGFNAFFIQEGIADDLLPAVTPRQCIIDNPFAADARSKRWPKVKDMNWVKV